MATITTIDGCILTDQKIRDPQGRPCLARIRRYDNGRREEIISMQLIETTSNQPAKPAEPDVPRSTEPDALLKLTNIRPSERKNLLKLNGGRRIGSLGSYDPGILLARTLSRRGFINLHKTFRTLDFYLNVYGGFCIF